MDGLTVMGSGGWATERCILPGSSSSMQVWATRKIFRPRNLGSSKRKRKKINLGAKVGFGGIQGKALLTGKPVCPEPQNRASRAAGI